MFSIGLSLTGRLKSSGFSPTSLFSAGEQGFWLEPSDLTTMFQDRDGTTPVTTPGQTVGLRLDKSKGLVLGSELVTNGDFATDTVWNKGSGWTISGGVASCDGSVQFSQLSQANVAPLAKYFKVSFTLVSKGASVTTVRVVLGGAFVGELTVSSAGTYSGYFFNSGASLSFALQTGAGTGAAFAITIDNISVKELPGNHAVAPTDAARPTYGIEPKTGRRNLLTRTEEFDNAAWTKAGLNAFGSGSVANTTATTDPVGGNTAEYIQENSASGDHTAYVAINLTAAPHTFTVYCKAAQRTWVYVRLAKAAGQGAYFNLSTGTIGTVETGITAAITSVGNGWYRCSVTITTDTTPWYPTILIATGDNQGAYTGNGTSGIYIWGAQLELSSTATAYQRVGTAFDVTEAGVPTVHYVQYDGTDDSFSTSSIDFSATDKMSVFAGVRKLSDATRGIVAELSAAATSGAWNLNAPNATTTANYAFRNVGSLSGGDAVTSSTFAAPTSNVLTALGDIAADVSQLRVNGSVAATSAVDLGTGNYGNYPLFIGRRGGTSLPFNGRDYGIIIVGKTASATEITNTELWLSDRTAEVDVAKTISPNIYTRSGDTILDRANSIIERRTV